MNRLFKMLPVAAVAMILAVLAGAAPAQAAQVSFKFDHNKFAAACFAAGGEYASTGGGHDLQVCQKANCDGKGGKCSVACDGDDCVGTTPRKLVGRLTFGDLLNNGFKGDMGGGDIGVRSGAGESTSGAQENTGGGSFSGSGDTGGGGDGHYVDHGNNGAANSGSSTTMGHDGGEVVTSGGHGSGGGVLN